MCKLFQYIIERESVCVYVYVCVGVIQVSNAGCYNVQCQFEHELHQEQ